MPEDVNMLKAALERSNQALETMSRNLEAANTELESVKTALAVLLKKHNEDRVIREEQALASIRQRVLPYIENLRRLNLNEAQTTQLNIVDQNLRDLFFPFSRNLRMTFLSLTPSEIQIANLTKEGKTTKEVANILGLSLEAVHYHRTNLRSKLGISGKPEIRLDAFLAEL